MASEVELVKCGFKKYKKIKIRVRVSDFDCYSVPYLSRFEQSIDVFGWITYVFIMMGFEIIQMAGE